MQYRDHEPVVIEEFNGLWVRGDKDTCPSDHFTDCDNLVYPESAVEVRPGIDILTTDETFPNVPDAVRIYTWNRAEGQSLLVLNSSGEIYHVLLDGSGTVSGPILSIPEMTDFGFYSPNAYAYITPFATFTDDNGIKYQKGIDGEFLYVYLGAGAAARKAAGNPPVIAASPTSFKAFGSQFDGVVSKGVHFITVTDQANNLLVEVFPVVYAPGNKEIELTNIPIGGGGVTGRKILMTRAIDPKDYVPDQTAYTYYEALIISDNTTEDAKISIADASLVTLVALGAIPTVNAMQAEVSENDGFADIGFHLIAVVYETDTGYLTSLGPENFAAVNVVDIRKAIRVFNIPTSPDSFVTKRHLVATRVINNYNGNQEGYIFYFIPGGEIDDNVTDELEVSFYDADLLEDASHLIDNFAEIPAGVTLNSYNSRMTLSGTFDDPSIQYFSAPGEPEAFDQVDGFQIVPIDGNPLTNGQEFRNIFYAFKKNRTFALVDNGNLPSEWPEPQPIDLGIGASVHGVTKVLDSGGVNIDFLLILGENGLMLFNGTYADPELTYKINDYWHELDENEFGLLQIVNDSILEQIYIVLPTGDMLYADYKLGLDAKHIKWSPWSFENIDIRTVALTNGSTVVLGAVAE